MQNLPLDRWAPERGMWRMYVMRNLPGSTVIGSVGRFCMMCRSVFVRAVRARGLWGARAVGRPGKVAVRVGAWADLEDRAGPGTPT